MTYFERIKKQFNEIIDDIYTDDDGAWICLKEGFKSTSMNCGTIHEDSFKKCYQVLKEGIHNNELKQEITQFNWEEKFKKRFSNAEKIIKLIKNIAYPDNWNDYIIAKEAYASTMPKEQITNLTKKRIQFFKNCNYATYFFMNTNKRKNILIL